jgi:hypothetical protein
VELVIHDPAVLSPLFDAVGERLPHIHARRLHSFPLRCIQLRPEKLIQCFLLAVLPKPQGLAGIQVTLKKLGIEKQGFHEFRRFRITHLETNRCPKP